MRREKHFIEKSFKPFNMKYLVCTKRYFVINVTYLN